MSETSEKARSAAKSKAERITRADPNQRVDASGYKPDRALNGDVVTGMRPISRRQFKRGGSVEGSKGVIRADRKPRANGGKTLTADSFLNRDVKEANKERGGITHVGGMKRGGRAGKLAGGPLMQATGSPSMPPTVMGRKEGGSVHASDCECSRCGGGRVGRKEGGSISKNPVYGGTRPVAGRLARKGGGRTKGKTNVNIIITQPGGMAGAPPPMAVPPPPGGPVGLHQGAPPPAPMGPPAGPAPMMRKSGGRTNYPIDAGAGSGLGRLEKAKAYG